MTDTLPQAAEHTEDARPDDVDARVGALAERLFGAALGAIDLFTVYVGARLDLYDAVATTSSGITALELADAARIAPRYAQEWLEQQTVTGFLDCVDRAAPTEDRRFTLPAGHDAVFLDPDSPASMVPLALAAAGIAGVLPALLEAYRTGGGVPYAAYGADFRDGQAGFNRPAFTHLLVSDWLANGLPDVHQRLSSEAHTRIADIACGAGWSSIALARAYPSATVDAFDLDDASIADARRNASESGVADRINFEVRDAATANAGAYDLVCVFEAVHDMSQPVAVLGALRSLVADGGTVLVADERAAVSFEESEGPIEAFLYGASVLHCLPVGLADSPSVGTGAVIRPATMARYAMEAGFAGAEVLPIEHDLFRFYRLT
jgi:2-polyprenyl-3-methyl-5-hydroxy-6-metoxy-1,4-benzoquinol methylase